MLHRLRLHLNANLRHLSNVTWSPDLRQSAVEVAATAVDGVRERFRMRLGEPEQVWHFDALLKHVFRDRKPRTCRSPRDALTRRKALIEARRPGRVEAVRPRVVGQAAVAAYLRRGPRPGAARGAARRDSASATSRLEVPARYGSTMTTSPADQRPQARRCRAAAACSCRRP